MLNKAMIIGRLGQDPEIRYTQTGTPITTFSVATDESYTDRDGNRQDRTEWHRVVVFQKQAELCSQYLSKGSLVYVEGSLQTRKWTDQSGQERRTTEIKAIRVNFLDRRGQNQQYDGGQRGEEGGYGGGYRRDQNQNRGGWGGSYQRPGGDQNLPPVHRPESGAGDGFAQRQQQAPRGNEEAEDYGPAFPSEAEMDKVPF